jgi:hypothetical protein
VDFLSIAQNADSKPKFKRYTDTNGKSQVATYFASFTSIRNTGGYGTIEGGSSGLDVYCPSSSMGAGSVTSILDTILRTLSGKLRLSSQGGSQQGQGGAPSATLPELTSTELQNLNAYCGWLAPDYVKGMRQAISYFGNFVFSAAAAADSKMYHPTTKVLKKFFGDTVFDDEGYRASDSLCAEKSLPAPCYIDLSAYSNLNSQAARLLIAQVGGKFMPAVPAVSSGGGSSLNWTVPTPVITISASSLKAYPAMVSGVRPPDLYGHQYQEQVVP